MTRLIYSLLLILSCTVLNDAMAKTHPLRVAVLDFGLTATGARAAAQVAEVLTVTGEQLDAAAIKLLDREESGAAARGIGYAGSLNLTLEEARDLGAAMGCDIYITGDAQTLRRSSSARPVYYESYASVFLVSARTGRLVLWDRRSFEAATPEAALKGLLDELSSRAADYASALRAAANDEREERARANTRAGAPVIEEVPDDASTAAQGLRLPMPYRRLRPAYPETAARAEAEATVDVLVDLDEEGEVRRVEVVRWAGFGLDEATVSTVRNMHFRPAMRDGRPLPMRVLLRYNFQRPKKDEPTPATTGSK